MSAVLAPAQAALARDLPGRLRLRLDAAAPLLLGAGAVSALGFAAGGYFPTAWAWGTLAFLWIAVVAIALGAAHRPGRAGATAAVALAVLAALSAASAAWSGSATAGGLSAQRLGLYAALVACALVVIPGPSAERLLAGVWLGGTMVCAYALATRLFPDRLASYDLVAGKRLSAPLGYWNSLGCLAAIASLLALGIAMHERTRAVRALAAASLPLLAATLYLTFSRGAFVAGAVGVGVAFSLARRRLAFAAETLALLAPAGVALAIAWRSAALSDARVSSQAAVAGAHRVAALVIACMFVAALVPSALSLVRRRREPGRTVRIAFAISLAAIPVAAAAVPVVRAGSPLAAVGHAWHAFESPQVQSTDLRRHLLSFSGSGRPVQYRMALRDFAAHPVGGAGAGTYERYWLLERQQPDKVRNVHSLFFETLAELGLPGLALLLVALAAPLWTVRALRRRSAAAAAATGAYVAAIVHTGVDWDWQLPAVTAAMLLIGVAMTKVEQPARSLTRREAGLALGAGAVVLMPAFVLLVGTVSLGSSSAAASAGRWHDSERLARRAIAWQPWSARGWQLLGEAQLGSGDAAAARTSLRHAIGRDAGDWSLWFDLARASTGPAQDRALAQAQRLDPLAPEIREFRQELVAERQIGVSR